MYNQRSFLPVGTTIAFGDRAFKIQNVIGAGGTGIIYRLSSVEKDQVVSGCYAMKEIFPVSSPKSMFFRDDDSYTVISDNEEALKSVKHCALDEFNKTRRINNFSSLGVEVLDFQQSGTLVVDREIITVQNCFIIMHLAHAGHTLAELLKEMHRAPSAQFPFRRGRMSCFTDEEGLSLVQKLLVPLEMLHSGRFEESVSESYLHCDLKPENIFLSGLSFTDINTLQTCSVVLLDFGSSLLLEKSTMTADTANVQFSGTYEYLPREGHLAVGQLTPAYDLFAVGAIFVKMTSLFTNFSSLTVDPKYQDFRELDEKLRRAHPESNGAVCEQTIEFVHKALASDPTLRFQSCDEMDSALSSLLKTIENRGITRSVLRRNIFKEVHMRKEIRPELLPNLCREGDVERTVFKNLADLLQQDSEDQFYQIVAKDGGAGKTTSMKDAQKQLLLASPNHIPFFIDMSTFQGEPDFLFREILRKYSGKPRPGESFEDRILLLQDLIQENRDYQFWFLIDGLQDSSDPYGDHILEEISRRSEFFRSSRTKIVISSKTRLFDKNLKLFEALPLAETTVREVLQKHNCLYNRRVMELCQNPMLLATALDLYENGADLSNVRTEADLLAQNHHRLASMNLHPDCGTPLHIFREVHTFVVSEILPDMAYTMYKVGQSTIHSQQLFKFVSEKLAEKESDPIIKGRLFLNSIEKTEEVCISIMMRLGLLEEKSTDCGTEVYVHQRYVDFYYAYVLFNKMQSEKLITDLDIATDLLDEHITDLLAGMFNTQHDAVEYLNGRCVVNKTDSDKQIYCKEIATANLMRIVGILSKNTVENESFTDLDFTQCDLQQICFKNCEFVHCNLQTSRAWYPEKNEYRDISEPLENFDICCAVDNTGKVYFLSSKSGTILAVDESRGHLEWNSAVACKGESQFLVSGIQHVFDFAAGYEKTVPIVKTYTIDDLEATHTGPIRSFDFLAVVDDFMTTIELDREPEMQILTEDEFLFSYRGENGLHQLIWVDRNGKKLLHMENVLSYKFSGISGSVVAQTSDNELVVVRDEGKKKYEKYELEFSGSISQYHFDYTGEWISVLSDGAISILDIQHLKVNNLEGNEVSFINDFHYLPSCDALLVVLSNGAMAFFENIHSNINVTLLSISDENVTVSLSDNAVICPTATGFLIGDGRDLFLIDKNRIHLLYKYQIKGFEDFLFERIYVNKNGTGMAISSTGDILQIDSAEKKVAVAKSGPNNSSYEMLLADPFGGFLRIENNVNKAVVERWEEEEINHSLMMMDSRFMDNPVWALTFINNNLYIIDIQMNLFKVVINKNGVFENDNMQIQIENESLFRMGYANGPTNLVIKDGSKEFWYCDILKGSDVDEKAIVCISGPGNTLSLYGVDVKDGLEVVFHYETQFNLDNQCLSMEEDRIVVRAARDSEDDFVRNNHSGALFKPKPKGYPVGEILFGDLWKAGIENSPADSIPVKKITPINEKYLYYFKDGINIAWSGESEAEKIFLSYDGFGSVYEINLSSFHFSGENEDIDVLKDLVILRGHSSDDNGCWLVIQKKPFFRKSILPRYWSAHTPQLVGKLDRSYLVSLEEKHLWKMGLISTHAGIVGDIPELIHKPNIRLHQCSFIDCNVNDEGDLDAIQTMFKRLGTTLDEKTRDRRKRCFLARYKSSYVRKTSSELDSILIPVEKIRQRIPAIALAVGETYDLEKLNERIGIQASWNQVKTSKSDEVIRVNGCKVDAVSPGIARIQTDWFGSDITATIQVVGFSEKPMEQLCEILNCLRRNEGKVGVEVAPQIELHTGKLIESAYRRRIQKLSSSNKAQRGVYSVEGKATTWLACGITSAEELAKELLSNDEIKKQVLTCVGLQGVCKVNKNGLVLWLLSFIII